MMKDSYNFNIALLAILLIFAGCNNEIAEPVLEKSWDKIEVLNNQESGMNSMQYDGNVFISTPQRVFRFSSPDDLSIFQLDINTDRYKFPIGKGFIAYTDIDQVRIKSLLTSPTNSTVLTVDMRTHDPHFSKFSDIPYWFGECMVIRENEILVPYEAVENGKQVNTPRFLRITITPPLQTDSEMAIQSIEIINEDPFPGAVSVYKIQYSLREHFIRMGGVTYRIDATGNLEQISDRWLNIFQHGPTLKAFAASPDQSATEYWMSEDLGSTWQNSGPVESIFFQLEYTSVAGRIVGFNNSKLYELRPAGDSFILTELNNNGLGMADITSIGLANDSTIVVTTRCNSQTTECGAYSIALDDLFNTGL